MTSPINISLGFRAFDIHELLVHAVARESGHYREGGLHVTLRDLTFLPEETDFTVACGAALMGWAKGARQKIVFVATDFPMFWLHAAPEIADVARLRGARIASYPAAAPPELFHRAMLRKHGLDPEKDVVVEATRDDAARLGLLKSGDVAAAVLSSATPPPMVQALGFRTLAFFGDEIRVPTTGLAVSEQYWKRDPEAVARMCQALAQAIDTLRNSPQQVIPVITKFFCQPAVIAQQTYELLRNYFTKDGRAAPAAIQTAMEMVNGQLPREKKLQAGDVYDFMFLRPRPE